MMKKKYTKEQIEKILKETIEETVDYFKKQRKEAMELIDDEDKTKKEVFCITNELKDTMTITKFIYDTLDKL